MEYKSDVQSSKPLIWSSKFDIKYLVLSEEYQADCDESWLFVASMDIVYSMKLNISQSI